MKKRKIRNLIIIVIIAVLVFLFILSILSFSEGYVEKEEGALHNLGKFFSFKWLFEGPITVLDGGLVPDCQSGIGQPYDIFFPPVFISNGARLQCVEECFASNPRWHMLSCVLYRTPFCVRTPSSSQIIGAGTFYEKSEEQFMLEKGWNPDEDPNCGGFCGPGEATFMPCDLNRPAYLFNGVRWEENTHNAIYQDWIYNTDHEVICPDDIRKRECAKKDGSAYSFLSDRGGFDHLSSHNGCDDDSQCYQGSDLANDIDPEGWPADRPYASHCEEHLVCRDIFCLEREDWVFARWCTRPYCGDLRILETGLDGNLLTEEYNEQCDDGLYCVNDPDPFADPDDPAYYEDSINDPSYPYKNRCKTWKDCSFLNFDDDGDTVYCDSCQKINTPACRMVDQNPGGMDDGCKCDGTYSKTETKCTKDPDGINRITTITKTYERLPGPGPLDGCFSVLIDTQESHVNCGECKKCGNYPLHAEIDLSSLKGGTFPTGPKNLGGPITINNPDIIKHDVSIGVSGSQNVDIINPYGNDLIIPTESSLPLLFKYKVKAPLENTEYGKIYIRFPGASYIYDVVFFMKGENCNNQNPVKRHLECLNYLGELPFDYGGLNKECTPENPFQKDCTRDQMHVCRFGECKHMCQKIQKPGGTPFEMLNPAIETVTDFNNAPNYNLDTMTKLDMDINGLVKDRENNIMLLLGMVCQCHYDNTNEMQDALARINVYDSSTFWTALNMYNRGEKITAKEAEHIGGFNFVSNIFLKLLWLKKLKIGWDYNSVSTPREICGYFNHENSHVLHRFLIGFDLKWREVAGGEIYFGEDNAVVEKIEKDDTEFLKYKDHPLEEGGNFIQDHGLMRAYSGDSLGEDVATFGGAVALYQLFNWKNLLTEHEYKDRYKGKLDLLHNYGFITKERYDCILVEAGWTAP